MLPFHVGDLETTLNNFHQYYVQKHGHDAYQKIYIKVTQSNKLAGFYEQSISRRLIPNSMDFNVLTSNMFLFASTEKITLAAIIALKAWNDRVNVGYRLVSKQYIDEVCREIFRNARIRHL